MYPLKTIVIPIQTVRLAILAATTSAAWAVDLGAVAILATSVHRVINAVITLVLWEAGQTVAVASTAIAKMGTIVQITAVSWVNGQGVVVHLIAIAKLAITVQVVVA